jgi:hypothetical protein
MVLWQQTKFEFQLCVFLNLQFACQHLFAQAKYFRFAFNYELDRVQ